MIAALYSARCTLTSEIEVKDNGSGNWLINPWEAKGLFEQRCQLMHAFQAELRKKKEKKKRKPSAFLQKGVSDHRAKGLNLPCQAQKYVLAASITAAEPQFGSAVRGDAAPHHHAHLRLISQG